MSEDLDNLVCAPIDTFEEIFEFLKNPPAWRSLCQELKPERHSNKVIRNMDVCSNPNSLTLENPATFCHYDPREPDLPRHDKYSLPKTLVCHDMANGYHDDAVVQGTSNYDAYTFCNWAVVDIFCYFSHHLVTIPPVSWINVGHAHGSKVIGTIITEWAAGTTFWDRVLTSSETLRDTARALTDIAKTLKFDGWLLNVENRVSEPLKLLEFVKTLHWLLHEELPNAELIWYDSVTIEGELFWQNQLNQHNRPFFDACDGLFTNYSWREADVARSVAEAGERRTDVYVGVDVWGRNFYGGGQLNTQQAMKVIWRHGCSAALFAPAWTHEAIPAEVCGAEARQSAFLLRDAALWGSLWPYLNTRLPTLLPFATTFCRGQGHRRFFYGEVVSPGPWFNLRHMQYQPNSAHGPHVYLVSTQQNLRALHLTASTRDLSPRPPFDGDTTEWLRVVSILPRLGMTDTSVATVEKRNVAAGRSTELIDIGTNSIEKCNVATERPPKRKVSFHLEDGTYEPGLEELEKNELAAPEQRSSGNDADEPPPDVGEETELRVTGTASADALVTDARDADALQVVCVEDERACAAPWWGDAFSGGACVALAAGDAAGPRHRTARLLHAELRCGAALALCVVSKRAAPNQQLDLLLHTHRAGGDVMRFALLDEPLDDDMCSERDRVSTVMTALGGGWRAVPPLGAGAQFDALRKFLLVREPGFYVPRDNAFGWNVRYYWIELGGGVVKSIGARCRVRCGPALLGHLALCNGPRTLTE